MSLQRALFAKRLVARWKTGAVELVLLWLSMSSTVSSKTCSRREGLVAAFPTADMISYICVCVLDVDFEVAFAEEVLLAWWVWAFEDTVVSVRSFMFGQSDGTREAFCTTIIIA